MIFDMTLKNTLKALLGSALLASSFAAETLFSNDVRNVNETGSVGTLWAFSRGQLYSGVTKLTLDVADSGKVTVSETKSGSLSDEITAVHDGYYYRTSDLAERRRVPSVYAGAMGYVLPMYEMDDDGSFEVPRGIVSVNDEDNLVERPLEAPKAYADTSAMVYAVSGIAYDSTYNKLWIARGAAGLGLYEAFKSSPKNVNFALDVDKSTLDTAKSTFKWDSKINPAIYGVAMNPKTSELWMATSQGMWIRDMSGNVKKGSSVLGTDSRVTGVWIGGDPLQIVAETFEKSKDGSSKGALWHKLVSDSDFSKVNFLDTAGKTQKKNVYDDGDYTVSNVAFIGENAFVGVTAVGGDVSGYFKLNSKGVRARDMDDNGKNIWLYGFETGATDRDAIITSICSFPLTKNIRGLAIATAGNGISVSADSGRTWNPILNRAKLGNDLGSVRMVPSVIVAGGQALVSYKVSKASKITIDVYSYDMKHVKTIVKDAPRDADASRSTDARVDFWDGYDKHKRACTMGIYYVRVKDNHGHVGWGKVMTVGGSK